jgi:hypothetical protein
VSVTKLQAAWEGRCGIFLPRTIISCNASERRTCLSKICSCLCKIWHSVNSTFKNTMRFMWDGMATRYGLGGPRIESRWGEIFPNTSRPGLGPTQAPVQWVPGLFLDGQSCRDMALTTHIHITPRLNKYLYSFSGHSGLFYSEIYLV